MMFRDVGLGVGVHGVSTMAVGSSILPSDKQKHLLLKKPNPDAVSEYYEPTQEEPKETFCIPSE